MKIKVYSTSVPEDLEEIVNEWLETRKGIEVIDIKFGNSITDVTTETYSAMIIYK